MVDIKQSAGPTNFIKVDPERLPACNYPECKEPALFFCDTPKCSTPAAPYYCMEH